MNYNTDIIRTYIEYLDLICQAFDTKPIQKKPFYTKLNMERHSFERKVKAKSFSLYGSIAIGRVDEHLSSTNLLVDTYSYILMNS